MDSSENLESSENYEVTDNEHGRTLHLGNVATPLDGEVGSTEDEEYPPRPVTEDDLAALAKVEDELKARWPETVIDPTLDRVELLMDLLGEPQKAYKVIHVAGTNGKTSTVRMIESLLRAFGHRVGRTTSPHLQQVTERIGIDGQPIHPAEFVRIYREIEPYIQMVDELSLIHISEPTRRS